VRGAFTGAIGNRQGRMEQAHKGTLFLDEVGTMSAGLQMKLLRVLQEREFERIGDTHTTKIDVRVIAATNSDLKRMVAEGEFREDLYYRLNVVSIHVPPLRERRDDVARLLLHFLGLDLAETGDTDLLDRTGATPWLPLALARRIMQHDWPGNVRQLRNVVRQIVIGSRGELEASLSPSLLRQLSDVAPPPAPAAIAEPTAAPPRKKTRKPAEISEAELVDALSAHRWDIKSTATALAISRTSLYKLIETTGRVRVAGHLGVDEIRACHRDLGGDLDAMVDRLQVSKHALRRRIQDLGLE
jgi:DNA-binding NtrC family response regulator